MNGVTPERVASFAEDCRDRASWLLAVGDLLKHHDESPIPAAVGRIIGRLVEMEAGAVDVEAEVLATTRV